MEHKVDQPGRTARRSSRADYVYIAVRNSWASTPRRRTQGITKIWPLKADPDVAGLGGCPWLTLLIYVHIMDGNLRLTPSPRSRSSLPVSSLSLLVLRSWDISAKDSSSGAPVLLLQELKKSPSAAAAISAGRARPIEMATESIILTTAC